VPSQRGTHLLPVDAPVQIIEKTADFLERRLGAWAPEECNR
jgi:hypothetical protein